MQPAWRPETLDPTKEYRLLGVRLDGRGVFHRETKLGSQIAAPSLFQVKAGHFVYSRLFAWRGAFGVVDGELDGGYVSAEFPAFGPVPGRIDVQFLRLWFGLPSTIASVAAQCTGSTPLTRNRFKEDRFLRLEIPLPELEEQRRIVARIRDLAAKIEEARGLRREAAAQAAALWAASAKGVLTASAKGDVDALGALAEVRGGGTPSKANPSLWQGRVPWVSPKDMKARAIYDSRDHISEEAFLGSPIRLIEPGAVLIVVRGMILAHTVPSAVLRVPAAINQDMKALVPVGRLSPEYMCAVLWAWNERLLALVEKSTHDTRKIETSKLVGFQIPVPSLQEQHRILVQLEELQTAVDALQRLQSQTAAELEALLPSVLDRAFKGEL